MSEEADLPEIEHFPMVDAIDHEILMHKDAHFGGLFSVMLDYYSQEGKGVQPEFSLDRIERLAKLEKELNQNLAAQCLSGAEMQKVAEVRTIYKQLRSLYEIEKEKSKHPRLIADLILSESEDAEEEVSAIVAEKGAIVPALLELLRNESFYDPLFPGYGQAPILAAKCLGEIGDKRAIITLFEAIGQSDFFSDDMILSALAHIGEHAKEFLLRVVKGRPLNEDNEKAAIGLLAFRDDEKVAEACLELLEQADIQKDQCLSTYLILVCEGLKDGEKRKAFQSLGARLPSALQLDVKTVVRNWN